MKTHILGSAALLLAVAPFIGAGCNQPAVQCQVGHASLAGYAIKYKLVSKTGDCGDGLVGDTIGLDDFHPAKEPNIRNIDETTVAIQASDLFDAQQSFEACWSSPDPTSGYQGGSFTDTKHQIYGLGQFKTQLADDNDFCYIDSLVDEQDVPAIPATIANTNPAPTMCSTLQPEEKPDADANDTLTCVKGSFDCKCPTPPACNMQGSCDDPSLSCTPNGTCLSPCAADGSCSDATMTCNAAGFCAPDNCCDVVPGLCETSCKTDADCCYADDTDCLSAPPAGLCDAKKKACVAHRACTVAADCCDPGDTNDFAACQAAPPATCDSGFCNDAHRGCTDAKDVASCCVAGLTSCPSTGLPNTKCVGQGADPKSCHTPAQPPFTIKYAWSNMKLLTTAAAPGTQFSADLDYTAGTCQAKYKAVAVWPSVDCTMRDADGNPLKSDGKTPLGPNDSPVPNPNACCPNPDDAHGFPSGSGIDPDFEVKCDPVLLLCVLDPDKSIPQLDTTGTPTGCSAVQPPIGSAN